MYMLNFKNHLFPTTEEKILMFRLYIFSLDHIRRQGHPSLLGNSLAKSDLWSPFFYGVMFFFLFLQSYFQSR